MSDTEPDVNIQVTNFPPSGNEGELRQLFLGPAGPTTLLLQTTYDNDTDTADIQLVLSNMCEHDDLVQTIDEAIELLTNIRDSAQQPLDEALVGAEGNTEEKE